MTAKKDTFDTGRALYYPYIHFQETGWLKAALLYWDGLRRIVPGDCNPNDEKDVAIAVSEGAVINTDPTRYLKKASTQFSKYFLTPSCNEKPLLSVTNADDRILKVDEGFFESLHWLYNSKIDSAVLDSLVKNHIGVIQDDKIYLDQRYAYSYMTCLASTMGAQIGTPMITDTPNRLERGEYLSLGIPHSINSAVEPCDIMLRIGIDFPDPASLAEVPIRKILKFHERYNSERRLFRQRVQLLITRFAEIEDPNAFEDVIASERQAIKDEMQDYRYSLDELNVKSVFSFFQISVPTLLTSFVGMDFVPDSMRAVIPSAGIAISIVNWCAKFRGDKRNLSRQNHWHYLLGPLSQFKR